MDKMKAKADIEDAVRELVARGDIDIDDLVEKARAQHRREKVFKRMGIVLLVAAITAAVAMGRFSGS